MIVDAAYVRAAHLQCWEHCHPITSAGALRVNPGTRKLAGLLLVAPISYPPEAAVAQSGAVRRETVRAGPATLHVTVRGQGEPNVFSPSRGRSIVDFDTLSQQLVQAGYQESRCVLGLRLD